MGDRAAPPANHLTVDDPDFLGAVGDSRLSLTEAIALAAGTLGEDDLSPAERARISGRPGAGRADVIGFVPGLRIALRRRDEPVDAILPPLTDAGDAIVGEGTVIDGSAMNGSPPAGAGRVADPARRPLRHGLDREPARDRGERRRGARAGDRECACARFQCPRRTG